MTVVKLPRRVRPIDPWFGLLTEASNSPGRPVNIRYMVSPFRYEFVALPQIDLSALAFKSSETKFAQLDRNYRNDASIAEAKAKLHSRAGAAYTSVAVELKGPQAKAGTSQGRCMQSLVVTVHPKGSTAHVFYRSTELVAKLAADFAFLEGIVGELGVEPGAWHFTFANAYLCPIHATSALALAPDPVAFLRSMNPFLQRGIVSFLSRVFERTKPMSYNKEVKQRALLLERFDYAQVKAACRSILVGDA